MTYRTLRTIKDNADDKEYVSTFIGTVAAFEGALLVMDLEEFASIVNKYRSSMENMLYYDYSHNRLSSDDYVALRQWLIHR